MTKPSKLYRLARWCRLVIEIEKIEFMQGRDMPWGYGLAFYEHASLRGYFMPLPLNLVARFVREAYWRIKWGFMPAGLEKKLIEEYARGRRDGMDHARSSNSLALDRNERELHRARVEGLEKKVKDYESHIRIQKGVIDAFVAESK